MAPKILLIEDSDDDVVLTVRALQTNRLQNEVTVIGDGVEALDFLFCTGAYSSRPTHEFPDIILLDLKLPKLEGLEVLRRIRQNERTRFLPVVVLTSSALDEDITKSYALGANSYVQKPVNFNDFVEVTRQLAMYWLKLNRRIPDETF